ncbi:hypothetical protein C8Q79DRAFT_1014100 [Trametes meyenii]|nr:hypothetical protein C8Q79DRAFT_1014100 [Trametes meyenii]
MANRAIHLEPEEFIHHFLSLPDDVSASERPTWDGNVFKGLENAPNMKEASIVTEFLAAINLSGLVPGFTLCESQDLPDKGDSTMQKVDAAFFRSDNVPTDGRPHWADQVVAVEFKAHDTSKDPFDDRPNAKVDPDAEERKRVRGQIIEYAEQIFRYQQRTFLFMLLVIGRRFRLLFWDRSGTITTRAVDYFENPDLLCEMLWRLGHLTEEQLGYDASVKRVLPGDADYTTMHLASLPHVNDLEHNERLLDGLTGENLVFRYVRQAFSRSLQPHWPRYRLDVPYKDTVRTFLVGKPEFFASGMAGRGTRGYVALDRESGRFVWLKDAWRAHYDLVDQEGSVLARLNNAEVLNVPTLVCHGDILKQITRTPEFWELKNPPLIMQPASSSTTSSRTLVEELPPSSKSLKRTHAEVVDSDETLPGTPEECPLRRHRHYRLVVKEVAMNLKAFQGGRQLVSIIYDCVSAHRDAMAKARIMHRDVSGGNILILPNAMVHPQTGQPMIKWTGILADWELSKPVHDKSTAPRARQPERTGTWQFMSVGTLSEHTKIIGPPDELESFFHVTLYYAIRYLRSNCVDVGGFIEDFFDSYTVTDKVYSCGTLKETVMAEKGRLLRTCTSKDVIRFSSAPLNDFFDSLLTWFKSHYAVQAYNDSLVKCSEKKVSSTCEAGDSDEPSVPSIFYDDVDLEFEDDSDANLGGSTTTAEVRKPTSEEEKNALKVSGHKHVLQALAKAMRSRDWMKDRVENDNVPDNFKPKRIVGPVRFASAATFKRLKKDAFSSPVLPFPREGCDIEPSTPKRRSALPGPFRREEAFSP